MNFHKIHTPFLNIVIAGALFYCCIPLQSFSQLHIKVKTAASGGIPFVDRNNHQNWENATYELQRSIDSLEDGETATIWIAGGTYFPSKLYAAAPDAPVPPPQNPDDPDSPVDERQASFVMANGVTIVGGFTGSEATPEDRPSDLYASDNAAILSGDIGIADESTDNSYHVVIFPEDVDDSAVLQNVIVTEGYADGEFYFSSTGAGVHIREGGILRSSIIKDNISRGSGGGVYLYKGGRVESCDIYSNKANTGGGGVYSNLGGLVTSSRIYSNIAGNSESKGKGGGVFIVSDGISEGTISESLICGNQASNKGGGIANYMGGIIINNLIINNETPGNGGGVYFQNGGQILNNTISGNTADRGAGAYCNDGGSFFNTVMWGNLTPYPSNNQFSSEDDATTSRKTISDYCAIQSGEATADNTNLIVLSSENEGTDNHPFFRFPVSFTGIPSDNNQLQELLNSDYRINLNSALLDAGNNDISNLFFPDTDYEGKERIIKSNVDIGAYETLYHHISGAVTEGNGSISPNTKLPVLEGKDIQFTITPASNYHITSFTVNTIDMTDQLSETIECYTYNSVNISEDIEAVVQFSIPNSVSNIRNSEIKIYPVPAREELFISGIEIQNLKIYSLQGHTIIDLKHNIPNPLKISNLEKGIYFLQITDTKGLSHIHRFLKE